MNKTFLRFNESDFAKVQVKFVPKGKTITVKRYKEGHIPEVIDFDFAIVDFGKLFQPMQDSTVEVEDRIKESTDEVTILSNENDEVGNALQTITHLANMLSEQYLNDDKRYRYQKALATICQPFVDTISQEEMKDRVGLLIERGALLIGSFYNFPKSQIIRVIGKRLDRANDTLGLGLSNLQLPANCDQFSTLHVQEDCIATGDTIGGLLLALNKKGVRFQNVIIDCPVATQMGIEFLLQFLPWLGVKKTTIRVGGVGYKLDEHYYLKRSKEEEYASDDYYVGDMGEWSEKLPKKYDSKAWWNKNRL